MSDYAIRVSLIHATTVQRDQASAAAWGDASSPDWQDHLTSLPCRYWVDAGREATDARTLVGVENMRLIVALGTDVTENDRLSDITYRGDTIVSGPIGIRSVLQNDDHLELVLEWIS